MPNKKLEKEVEKVVADLVNDDHITEKEDNDE